MAVVHVDHLSGGLDLTRKAQGPWARLLEAMRRKPMAAVGAALIGLILVFVAVGPYLTGYGPLESDNAAILAKPSGTHWLGTDQYGRDIFTRIAVGGRISLAIGVGAVVTSTLLGSALGLFSGYLGGRTDFVVQRFVDAEMSMPTLLILLVLQVLSARASIC